MNDSNVITLPTRGAPTDLDPYDAIANLEAFLGKLRQHIATRESPAVLRFVTVAHFADDTVTTVLLSGAPANMDTLINVLDSAIENGLMENGYDVEPTHPAPEGKQ